MHSTIASATMNTSVWHSIWNKRIGKCWKYWKVKLLVPPTAKQIGWMHWLSQWTFWKGKHCTYTTDIGYDFLDDDFRCLFLGERNSKLRKSFWCLRSNRRSTRTVFKLWSKVLSKWKRKSLWCEEPASHSIRFSFCNSFIFLQYLQRGILFQSRCHGRKRWIGHIQPGRRKDGASESGRKACVRIGTAGECAGNDTLRRKNPLPVFDRFQTDGALCCFEEAMVQLVYYEKKQQRSMPWHCDLNIGSKLDIKVSVYVNVSKVSVVVAVQFDHIKLLIRSKTTPASHRGKL